MVRNALLRAEQHGLMKIWQHAAAVVVSRQQAPPGRPLSPAHRQRIHLLPWRIGLRIGLTIVLVLCLAKSRAIDEADVDFAVLADLNRLQFYDYSQMLLQQMEQQYADRREAILIEKARTFYSCGKSKEADEALNEIKPGSSVYAQALLLKGEVAATRGRNEDAAEAYAEFFRGAQAPEARNVRAVELYTRAISVYSTVLKRLGKGTEAAHVLELLADVSGASGRKLAFLKAQAVIDTEEGNFNGKKSVNREAITTTLGELEQLQYQRDGVAASAYLEMARAHILLAGDELNTLRAQKKGKDAIKIAGFKKALAIIKMADEADLLRDIEKQVAKGAGNANSPYAGALFYKAEAYRGLALAYYLAGDQGKSHRLAVAAGKLYETVIVDYGKSDYRMRALSRHGKAAAFLEQAFGENLELTDGNVDAEMDLKLEQAQAFLQSRNFHGAIPIYLAAVRLGRQSKRLPDVVSRLLVCYGNLEQFLEAEALCSYLIDVAPASEDTAECLFRLGAIMYEKAKTLSGPARDRLQTRAMIAWEQFVDQAPDHSKAPEVSFAIAEHYYRLATDISKQAAAVTDAAEKEGLKTRARTAYEITVPAYLRLVNRYSSVDKGVRALYKLGWVYTAIGKINESVDAFLRYSEAETLPAFADDRLEAKFRAAEQLMFADGPAEAAEHFSELLAWIDPVADRGFDPSSAVAIRLREDAMSYLAWSYDLAGEQGRPALTHMLEELRQLALALEEEDKANQAAEAQIKTVSSARKDLERKYLEQQEMLSQSDLDFAGMALVEAQKRGESTAGKPEAEQAIVRRNIATEAQRLAADMAERTRIQVDGARTAMEAEREQIKRDIVTHTDSRQRLEAAVEPAQTDAMDARTAAAEAVAKLAAMRDARATVEKEIIEGEARAIELEETLQETRTTLAKATGEARLQTLRTTLDKTTADLKACRTQTTKAYARRAELSNPTTDKQIVSLQQAVSDSTRAATAAQDRAEALARRLELLVLEGGILQARLRAVAKALDANRTMDKALAADSAEKKQTLTTLLQEQVADALLEHDAVNALQKKRLDLLEATAERSIQASRKRRDAIATSTAEMTAQLQPLRQTFTEWKTKAAAAFVAFLEANANSPHVPANLSRLGTIYLELGDYGQAAATLDRLAREFPDSSATRDAVFSLGRAQCEQHNMSQAAASFAKLMEKPDSITSANLSYIAEHMLEDGDADLSLAASRELIKRSDGPADRQPDQPNANTRASSLYRAGRAAFALRRYAEALEYFEHLLREYPRTGYFYDVKFAMAAARSKTTPPDLDGAIDDLIEVLQYTDDPVLANKALCLTAEAFAAQDNAQGQKQALSRYQQVVLLADPDVAGNRPWIEMAIVGSAKACAALGRDAERDQLVALYTRRFPGGERAAELRQIAASRGAASEAKNTKDTTNDGH